MTHLRPFRLTPWVLRLLAANVGVFFLQVTIFTSRWVVETFGFAPALVLRRPWTPVTYMFLHGDFLHLAFNMLMLVVFGPAVEERLGSRTFLRYYLVSGLGGAVLSMVMAPVFGLGYTAIIGSSGAMFGVALAFAWFWPDAPIFVFPLPVPIKARWLVAFMAALSLVLAIRPVSDGTAHLAHLGGFLFGLGFLRLRGQPTTPRAPIVQRVVPTKVLVHPTAARSAKPASREAPPKDPTQAEIDRVLDKISASGLDSLSPDERRFLIEISRRLQEDH